MEHGHAMNISIVLDVCCKGVWMCVWGGGHRGHRHEGFWAKV